MASSNSNVYVSRTLVKLTFSPPLLVFPFIACLSFFSFYCGLFLCSLKADMRPTLSWNKHATHGRAKEVEEIKKIIKEINDGAPSRIVAITGPSGIGKSVLVTEGVYPVASSLGYTASGKFDQFLPQTPYAAVLRCLRSLFHSFFFNSSLSPSHRASLSSRLSELVGPNKEILCGAIPELSPLLPSPPLNQYQQKITSNNNNNYKNVSILSPTQIIPDSVSISETRNRFHAIFLGILGMIAAESMITIFVDDVQWADTASIELLASLVEGQRRHLLVLVASREPSLPPPLSSLPLTTLFSLTSFTPQLVLDFVRTVLHLFDDTSIALATALHARTAGNPFFVSQLLRQAISDGIVAFDSRSLEWVIDVPRIAHMSIVSDVVEFLLSNLKKLPTAVSEVLRVASCLGSTFCVDSLELVLAKFDGDMHGLYLAEVEGLVVREPTTMAGSIVFRFSHDRVMQASHSKNTDLQIQQIHLAAGEVLMQQGRDLYEIADHYAKALPLVPPDKLLSLCSLFLKVAKNAKIAAAFDSASRYAQVGIDILTKTHVSWDAAWRDSYNFIYPLLFIAMECAFNHGDLNLSLECFKDIQEHATLEGAMLALSARMILLVNESQFSDAIDLGCEGIARLSIPGVTMPRHPTQAELGVVFSEIDRLLQGSIYSIFESLPPLTHQLVSLAVTILMSASTASYFYDVSVFAYSCSLIVQLTLQYGLTPQATPGLAIYGLLCSSITEDVKRAYEIGDVATILSNKHGMPVYQCQVHFLFYSVIHFYQKHVKENLAHLRRGLTLCAQVGNTLFGAFNAVHVPMTRLWKSDALEEVAAECIFTLDSLGAQCRFADALPMTSGVLYCCRSLMGVSCIKELEASRVYISPFGSAWAATLRVKAHNLLHKYEDVITDINAHCKNVFEDIKGQMHICMLYFHYSLTLASLYYRDNPTPSATPNSLHYVDRIKENLVVLQSWATKSPINCEHRCILIQAELAHIAQRNAEALELYEAALQIAIQREFFQHSAMILERIATFFLRTGHIDRGRETLMKSIDAYARWGACAVISVLVLEHADLLNVKTIIPLDPIPFIPASGTEIDVSAVLDCSSVVSETSNLGKLLIGFLSRIVAYFNVAYGCLLLTQASNDACYAHVRWSRFQNAGAPSASLLRPPVLVHETFRDLNSMTCCARAVRCATIMKRTVVVSDLPASGMFSDAYFTPSLNAHARSLVSMPLLLHNKVLGAIYIESDNPHAFTLGGLQTLQLMCAQAVIAIENSHLVEKEVIARAEAEAAIAEKDLILNEMQASQQRYQTLAQAIPQLIWTARADGFVEWANDQFTSYIGSSILGDVWSEYVHVEDAARARSAWLAATLPGASFCEELRLRDGNGNYQWFLCRALAAHDSKGNVVRWFGTNTNVDAQKKSLEERARLVKIELSERYYRTLAEALPQLVWTSLADGRVNYYNGKWREFGGVGLVEGEVMGWWPLVHPNDLDACKKHFERSYRKCRGFELECRLKRFDGQFRWHLVRAVRMKESVEQGSSAPLISSPSLQSITADDIEETPSESIQESGYYYFGTCTDIDDQKKAEVSLIDARKAAERMAEMKSQWVANMSHELRTPSNGILGMLDLLMDTPLTPEQKDYVATMRRSTNVLLTVISDILDFRRNETRQVKLQVEPFTVHGVMEDVCEILFPLAAAKNVELVHIVSPDIPRALLGDPARLRQVLVNLIGNSIKFSNESGGHVEVSCRLTTTEPACATQSSNNPTSHSSTPSRSPHSSRSSTPSPGSSPQSSPPLSPHFSSMRLRHSSEIPYPNLSHPTPSSPSLPSNFVSITNPVSPPNFPSPRPTFNPPTLIIPTTPPTTIPNTPPVVPATPLASSLSSDSSSSLPTSNSPMQTVCLQFDVSDSGVGIPKEQQAMLFEPFFQVDSSATRKHGGTGLGLAISRQIVAALGGRIWVQSEEGNGSTFSFTSQFPVPTLPVQPTSTLRPSSSTNRFFAPLPLSGLIGDHILSCAPQHVVIYSDRKGATMRVLLDYLSQMIPSMSPPNSQSIRPVSVISSTAELAPFISQLLSQPSSSPSLPYVACVLELSDVPSTNSILSLLSPFLSRRDYIFRAVIITSPHLRSQITLPSPSATPYSPTLTPMAPSVVFLMKPMSESKLIASLSLSPVSSPTTSTVVQSIPASPLLTPLNPASPLLTPLNPASPLLTPSLNPASPTVLHHPPHSPSLCSSVVSPLHLAPSSPTLSRPSSPSHSFNRNHSPSHKPSSPSRNHPLAASSPSSLSLSSPITSSSSPRAVPPPLRLSASVDDGIDRNEKSVRRALCAEDIANDGSEAVDMVASQPIGYYEFLLMDLQMPVMDGFVATKLIRDREATFSGAPTLPIIAITANVMPGVQKLCSDAGMDGYVSKPVQAAQLSQVLRELAIII